MKRLSISLENNLAYEEELRSHRIFSIPAFGLFRWFSELLDWLLDMDAFVWNDAVFGVSNGYLMLGQQTSLLTIGMLGRGFGCWPKWGNGWVGKGENSWGCTTFALVRDSISFANLASYFLISRISCPNSFWTCAMELIRAPNWSPIFPDPLGINLALSIPLDVSLCI